MTKIMTQGVLVIINTKGCATKHNSCALLGHPVILSTTTIDEPCVIYTGRERRDDSFHVYSRVHFAPSLPFRIYFHLIWGKRKCDEKTFKKKKRIPTTPRFLHKTKKRCSKAHSITISAWNFFILRVIYRKRRRRCWGLVKHILPEKNTPLILTPCLNTKYYVHRPIWRILLTGLLNNGTISFSPLQQQTAVANKAERNTS